MYDHSILKEIHKTFTEYEVDFYSSPLSGIPEGWMYTATPTWWPEYKYRIKDNLMDRIVAESKEVIPLDEWDEFNYNVAAGNLVESAKAGTKDDQSKLRMDLIPPEAIEALADALTFGSKKYGDRNWEKGMNWGRIFGALMRHLWAWWGGKDLDSETGKSHLWHALACLVFLVTYEERNIGKDDRHE